MSNSLKLSLCAVGGFLLGLSIGSLHWTPPDVKVWEDRVARYQKDSTAYERMLATYAGERARLVDAARQAEARRAAATIVADLERIAGRVQQERADSLVAALKNKPTQSDSVPVLVQALEARTEEAQTAHRENESLREGLGNAVAESLVLRGVINTQDSVIATVTNRLAIADELLRNRPQPERCRVLWFNCPSRTTAFVAGAALASGAFVLVQH